MLSIAEMVMLLYILLVGFKRKKNFEVSAPPNVFHGSGAFEINGDDRNKGFMQKISFDAK